MRYSGVIGVLVLVWLLIGVFAAYQRHYFQSGETTCNRAASVALTVIAGPLNYAGVNPQANCPKPSSMPAVDIGPVLEMESQ